MSKERAGLAEDRIGFRQSKARDVLVGARTFAGLAIPHIHVLSWRVCADYLKVAARSKILVPDACWNDDHISHADCFDHPRFTTQLHFGRSTVYKQDFM